VGGDAGLNRPDDQQGRDGGQLGGQPGLQHLAAAGPPERGGEPLQLRTQRPGRLPLDDLAEGLQHAAGPASSDPHLVYRIWLIPADQRAAVCDGRHLVAQGRRAPPPPQASAPSPAIVPQPRGVGNRPPSARASVAAVMAGPRDGRTQRVRAEAVVMQYRLRAS
jgi:hypothetical protein